MKTKLKPILIALAAALFVFSLASSSCVCSPFDSCASCEKRLFNEYTVTFELNGGDGTPPTAQIVKHGKYATEPADPVREALPPPIRYCGFLWCLNRSTNLSIYRFKN